MEEQHITQAELARRVGVTQPAIFAIIRKNKTGTKSLYKIAQALRTTPAYLSGETDDPNADAPDAELSFEEREWVEWLRHMGARDRKAMLHVARSLAGLADNDIAPPTLHSPQLSYHGEERR